MLKQIINILKQNSIEAYFPGQHPGECFSEYAVVKQGGSMNLEISSERTVYTIFCFVPKNKYSSIELFVRKTKEAMKELYPMLIYAGNETPSFYDDDLKGHMVSFQYLGCRRILK